MSFINGGLSQKTVFASNHNNIHDMRERRDSSELSIFDAKKYFNELSANTINKVSPLTTVGQPRSMSQDLNSDEDLELSRTCTGVVTQPSSGTVVTKTFSSPSTSSDHHKYHRSCRARSFHYATPTASSEASWNSQTGLLSNPPGVVSVSVLHGGHDSNHRSERKTRKQTSSRWIFGSSKCPCAGKKSVQVQVQESKVISEPKTSIYINNNTIDDSHSQSKLEMSCGENAMLLQQSNNDVVWSTPRRFPSNVLLQGPTTQRVIASTGFTFPILKNNTNNGAFPIRSINPIQTDQDPPRDSLEVFKPSFDSGAGGLKSRILASMAASGGNATIVNDFDDVASDASSDLFEIESFSTQTTTSTTAVLYPAMFHRPDSIEHDARRLGLAAPITRRSLDEPMTPSNDWYEPSEASIDWSVTTAEGFDRASIANMSEAEEPWSDKKINHSNNNNNNRRRSISGNGLLSCRSEKAVSVGPQPVTKHVGSRPPLGKKPPLAKSNSARLSLTFAV